jgi:hypothetical protein
VASRKVDRQLRLADAAEAVQHEYFLSALV